MLVTSPSLDLLSLNDFEADSKTFELQNYVLENRQPGCRRTATFLMSGLTHDFHVKRDGGL